MKYAIRADYVDGMGRVVDVWVSPDNENPDRNCWDKDRSKAIEFPSHRDALNYTGAWLGDPTLVKNVRTYRLTTE